MTDPTQKPDDEFASAFAELQTPAPSTPTAAAAATAASDAPVSPSAPAPAAAEATPSAAAAPSGTPEGNASATSVPATPAAGVEAGTPTAAQPAATPSAEPTPAAGHVTAEQFAALQAELAELKKPAPTPTPAAAEPKPVYTAEEQQIVDDYLKEWPDTARGEALMRRAEYQQLVRYVWDQFAPRLDALEQVSQRTTTRTQYQEIKELVSDYDQVRDPTLAWIDTQPEYLKAAYQNVANTGSAKDVADLITRFKKETNYVAPATAAAPPAAAAPAGVPAPAGTPAAAAPAAPAPAAAAAAAALKPVATSRSTPVSTPDPNDFDSAFKEFASAG